MHCQIVCAASGREYGVWYEYHSHINGTPNRSVFISKLDVEMVGYDCGKNWEPMFVLVSQQRQPTYRLIPSVVRLHLFKDINDVLGNRIIRRGLFGTLRWPLDRIITNRKVDDVFAGNQRTATITSCDLPHDLIENTPETVKAISDWETQLLRWQITRNGIRIPAIGFRFHADTNRGSVRVEVPVGVLVKSVNVFVCPDDFEACFI